MQILCIRARSDSTATTSARLSNQADSVVSLGSDNNLQPCRSLSQKNLGSGDPCLSLIPHWSKSQRVEPTAPPAIGTLELA